MPQKSPMILKARRTKMIALKLNVQFDSNEIDLVKAYLEYQKNVSSFDELAEIGILDLIKRDLVFMKKFNAGEFVSEGNPEEKKEKKSSKIEKPDENE